MNKFFCNSSFSKRLVMGLALCIVTSFQIAVSQGMSLGVQPKSFLTLNPQVQQEIKLSESQIKTIKTIFGDTVSTDDQGRTRIQLSGNEDMDQMNSDVLKLLNATQMKRLTEIWMQRVGPSALGTKEIQKKLALDEAQIKKINALMEAFQDEMHGLIMENNGMMTPEIMKPAQDKLKEKLKAILSKEQLERFEAMKGVEFKMKP